MAASRQIIDLRKLLTERFPSSPRGGKAIFHTGVAPLDQFHGGLLKSAITEISSPQISAGSASLIHRLIQTAQNRSHFLALIDGSDSFDPQSLPNDYLRHLLWVRCTQTFEAIKAADLLLRDGNFPLVILDLVLNPAAEVRKIPQTSWYRLQRLVEVTSTVCLVMTRHSIVSSAQLKLVLENSWTLKNLTGQSFKSQLRLHIQRAHLNPELRNQRSHVS